MDASQRIWAVVPAAGIGTRMQSELPKQYMQINGRYILDYVLEVFCQHSRISGMVVAVAEHDTWWSDLKHAEHEKIHQVLGGRERCHSVLNALSALTDNAEGDDWVMVHDAARPCLLSEDIDRLIDKVTVHGCGGILAAPVRDTMKRGDTMGVISETVDREGLWHALTPQMFRLEELKSAIENALLENIMVTDEAQAIELTGVHPLLVEGDPGNIKVTLPRDLKLAEVFLSEKGGD